MLFERKTKDSSQWHVILLPVSMLIVFLGLATTVGFGIAFYVLGALFLVLSSVPFLIYARMRNTGHLVMGLFQLFAGLMCLSAPAAIENKHEPSLMPLFLVFMYATMLATLYHAVNRRLRWRGQEIFELAAMQVEDTGNSYSARPRPAGKVQVSKTEMIRFVDFVLSNLIAFVFHEENRIVFVLALPGNDWPYIFGYKKDYQQDTWVAIDMDGQVTVNITEKDYLLFKQDLDFDQICQAVGNVFAEFLTFSQEGREAQIIDRMNALRLNPFQ